MSTLSGIMGKDWGSTRYEWYLYTFPRYQFFKKTREISEKLGFNIMDGIRDELWLRGLIQDRGSARMGREMRGKIKEALAEIGVRAIKRVKRADMILRQEKGREELKEFGRTCGYTLIEDTAGLVMWNRGMGFLVVCGGGWAYVYKTGTCVNFDKNMNVVGYFQLGGSNVKGQLIKAMDGNMTYRVYKFSCRQRMYMCRKGLRGRRIGLKRKQG
jgi:hypothetical protein